ncbi:hypothetical protein [Bradyrhizobium sp. Ec3.3]|uniref:hypothetical protein n=1 Tax=Bradyrhizobium sp. Ec3.3 TaxID=189753 RepID=UPI000488960D|nr:hypothetical protein [Bradyrhizobium sp. Ec3.3]
MKHMLNDRQVAALRIGEQAIEDLDFRDRDGLIAKGLAVRAWPKATGTDWKTWLTPAGAQLRLELFSPSGEPRA